MAKNITWGYAIEVYWKIVIKNSFKWSQLENKITLIFTFFSSDPLHVNNRVLYLFRQIDELTNRNKEHWWYFKSPVYYGRLKIIYKNEHISQTIFICMLTDPRKDTSNTVLLS